MYLLKYPFEKIGIFYVEINIWHNDILMVVFSEANMENLL